MAKMNILISTNDRYIMPTAVLLESLYGTQKETLNIYLLWSELSEQNRKLLQAGATGHKAYFTAIEVDGSVFADLPTKEYISRETYYRLLAADYLPENLDRILWLDSDMIARADFSSFYHSDFEGNALIACPHGEAMRKNIDKICTETGLEYREQYFNAGTMLCNLSLWRKMNIREKLGQILGRNLKLTFPGQDVTNLVFNGSVKTENYIRYNCMIHCLDTKELMTEALRDAVLVHFVGASKPWEFYDLPFAEEWLKIYKSTSFGETPLKLRSYFEWKRLYEKIEALKRKRQESGT